jgi:hypothetical protein
VNTLPSKFTWPNTAIVDNGDLTLDSNKSTFTVATAGLYLVDWKLYGPFTNGGIPSITLNNPTFSFGWQDATTWGTYTAQSNLTGGTNYLTKATLVTLLNLSAGDTLTTSVSSGSTFVGFTSTRSDIKFVRLN